VTLDGRDFYLGRYGSPESRAEYDRLIVEWIANGRRLPAPTTPAGSDLTVNECLFWFVEWSAGYYRKDGRPTSEARMIRDALKVVRRLYGDIPAADFSPLKLKAVRQALIDLGHCRSQVNKQVGRVVRCFAWYVENELVPPSVHHVLKAVKDLRRGRTEAKESEPVRPVAEADVESAKPFLARQVWTMVELQRFTGMRPGEVVIMRTMGIDRSGPVWAYTPRTRPSSSWRLPTFRRRWWI
jgi:hypothetical protein